MRQRWHILVGDSLREVYTYNDPVIMRRHIKELKATSTYYVVLNCQLGEGCQVASPESGHAERDTNADRTDRNGDLGTDLSGDGAA
jgi:hypothetical protein